MFLNYRLDGIVAKLFNIQFETGKGFKESEGLKVPRFENVRNPFCKQAIEQCVAIRQQNEAISTILDAIESAKVDSTKFYKEVNLNNSKIDDRSLILSVNGLVNFLDQNSPLKEKIDLFNKQNPVTKLKIKANVLLSPVAERILHYSTYGIDSFNPCVTSDLRIRNKIIVMLSVEQVKHDAELIKFDNLKFGDLFIEEEFVEDTRVIPYYRFNINNHIFGVIDFNEEAIVEFLKQDSGLLCLQTDLKKS